MLLTGGSDPVTTSTTTSLQTKKRRYAVNVANWRRNLSTLTYICRMIHTQQLPRHKWISSLK